LARVSGSPIYQTLDFCQELIASLSKHLYLLNISKKNPMFPQSDYNVNFQNNSTLFDSRLSDMMGLPTYAKNKSSSVKSQYYNYSFVQNMTLIINKLCLLCPKR
jgi:hypothetical protein